MAISAKYEGAGQPLNGNLRMFCDWVEDKTPKDFNSALEAVNRVSVHRSTVQAVEVIRPSSSRESQVTPL
jgi:hypothetical protein